MALPRRWRILGYLCGSFAIIALLVWTWFYLDSIRQRHRAEALIADLKTFPFQTATFATVRDFALAHGGAPAPAPDLGRDAHVGFGNPGPNWMPQSPYDPNCNAEGCAFQVHIQNRAWMPSRPALLAVLCDLGIRPWSVSARFEINGDHLARSSTKVLTTERRPLAWDGSRVFVDVGYVVISEAPPHIILHPAEPTDEPNYSVHYRYVTNSFHELLLVRFLQIPSAPVSRAYDIDLRCLTALTSVCTHAQLAPSSWADRPQRQN